MRIKTEEIIGGIYLIGGPNITSSDDAAVYLIDFAGDLVLIDAGAGKSLSQLLRNIEMLGLNPANISHLILTHCHIDHIGSAPFFNKRYKTKIVIHKLDAEAVETGDSLKTAANWYGTAFPPTKVDRMLSGSQEILKFGQQELHCLHTPGHTPGSTCYLANSVCFVGDTLFAGSIGRPSSPQVYQQMLKGIGAKILSLPDSTILLPGHGPATTVGEENRHNPFF